MFFHTHYFQETQNPNRLYCSCGERRCIHQWEEVKVVRLAMKSEDLVKYAEDRVACGWEYILRCQHCGVMDNHFSSETNH